MTSIVYGLACVAAVVIGFVYLNRWMSVEPPPTLQPRSEEVTHWGFLSSVCGGAIVGDSWSRDIAVVTCPKCRKIHRSRRSMKINNRRRKHP